MTGRGAGFCAGAGMPGYPSLMPGRGMGMGWGGGWGGGWGRSWGRGRRWRHQAYATSWPAWARPGWGAPLEPAYAAYAGPPSKEQEARLLRAKAEWLKDQLDAITRQVEELEQQER